MGDWQPIAEAPSGIVLETVIADAQGLRNDQQLIKRDGLWWFPDFSMYVYYEPTHWRYRS